MVKVQNNKGQFRITIPRDIARLLKLKQGTEVIVLVDSSNNIIIKKIEVDKNE